MCADIFPYIRISKSCLSVYPYPERNYPSFVHISPTVVMDTSIERSSRVLQHGNRKKKIFFSKMVEIEFSLVMKC